MSSLNQVNKYFIKYKWYLIGGVFFITISNIFAIYPAKVTRYSFDLIKEQLSVYQHLNSEAAKNELMESIGTSLLLFGLYIIGSSLLKGLFMFFMRQTIIVMSRHIEYDQKNEIYRKYQELSTSFYKTNNTGDLMNRISEDVGKVRMYTGPAIMYLINLVVLSVLVVIAMYNVNPELTLYVLTPLPLMAVLIYYIQEKIQKKSSSVQGKLSDLSTIAQESFAGIRVIKAFAKKEIFRNQFIQNSDQYKKEAIGLSVTEAFFSPLITLLVGASTILTIYIGGIKAIEGSITIGNIAEFIIYVNMLTWPFTSLGWVSSLIQRAKASQKRINEFLLHDVEISNAKDSVILKEWGDIVFDKVQFTYPHSGIKALVDITFTVKKGHSLGIIGKTGSGKSTAANLLMRMYDTGDGTISIDGIDIKKINLKDLRTNIGYVPQEVFLFSDTISNNISFGLKTGITSERIQAASKDAAVYENIVSFPQAFETEIGERGITLSGGQKQRISIARAIIKDPKLLIFDDCLSAVDTETEDEILKNLKRIMKGKTSVIISHRVSSVKNADQIIVLDKGQIVEKGTHDELMQLNGKYAEMYVQQVSNV